MSRAPRRVQHAEARLALRAVVSLRFELIPQLQHFEAQSLSVRPPEVRNSGLAYEDLC